MTDEWINQCPNGHASPGGDGQCVISGCGHQDPIVTAPKQNKKGLDLGNPSDYGYDRRGRKK